ncbi:hypothetical protein [Solimonas soli]|uniref:hypothetical protein n=1 Tax=Solimonas soli TaxID=413479 RepID=UPI0004833F6E|nr:hypothetical protein [Solimonas soli]
MKMHSAYAPLGLLLLAAGFAVPAQAQDAATDPAATESTTTPDAASGESTQNDTADAATPADSGTDQAADSSAAGPDSTGTEAAGGETAPADGSADAGSSDTAASDESRSGSASREPFYVYGGVDYAFLSTSLSKDSLKQALGGDEFDSDFYRLRVGTRLFPSIGIEAQFGVKNEDGNASDKVETNQMYGLYVVPTGNLFRFLEVSAPIGYSHLRLENNNGSVKFDSLSFGLNVEFPVYVNPESRFPDVRIGGGGVVYYAEREARTYSYHAGVRLDFKL